MPCAFWRLPAKGCKKDAVVYICCWLTVYGSKGNMLGLSLVAADEPLVYSAWHER